MMRYHQRHCTLLHTDGITTADVNVEVATADVTADVTTDVTADVTIDAIQSMALPFVHFPCDVG
jgi:hypothetical protein